MPGGISAASRLPAQASASTADQLLQQTLAHDTATLQPYFGNHIAQVRISYQLRYEAQMGAHERNTSRDGELQSCTMLCGRTLAIAFRRFADTFKILTSSLKIKTVKEIQAEEGGSYFEKYH